MCTVLGPFGQQTNNVSQGRFPDGGPDIYWMTGPTPRTANAVWANRYPVLDPISDTNAYVDQTLSFLVGANDPDAPPQILGFTLDAGAPAGAMIHPGSGLFSWTPTPMQSPGTNIITVRVADIRISHPGTTPAISYFQA